MELLRTLGAALVHLLRQLAGRLAVWLHEWSADHPSAPDARSAAVGQAEEQLSETVAGDDSPEDDSPEDEGRTTAEKLTTLISVLLIAFLACAILYEGYATGQADPATLEVTVLMAEIEQRGDAFYIPIEILNDGDQTVEEVAVGIEILDGETVVDEAETVIATLGEAEIVTVVLILTEDPTGMTIEAGVVTFQVAED